MYVFRELTDLSYPAIAREFGGRDHTTVIHAVEKIGALMKERRQIYDQVTELIQTHQERQMTLVTAGAPSWSEPRGRRCGPPRVVTPVDDAPRVIHRARRARRGSLWAAVDNRWDRGQRASALTSRNAGVVHNPQPLLPLLTRIYI